MSEHVTSCAAQANKLLGPTNEKDDDDDDNSRNDLNSSSATTIHTLPITRSGNESNATLDEKKPSNSQDNKQSDNLEMKNSIRKEETSDMLQEAEKSISFNATETLSNLNEVSYIKKSEKKVNDESIQEFQGHDTKWFENSRTDETTLTENDMSQNLKSNESTTMPGLEDQSQLEASKVNIEWFNYNAKP